MLTVLNIIIIIVLLGMAAIWATYGFFSSFLHLVLVIISGTFAFAVWEHVAYILLGRMPMMAWGVGLLAPFALSLIILRTLFDKYCKMNLKFPRIADQIGGAICGVGSGVLTLGVLIMGIGFLSLKPDIMGYQPYRMARNTVEPNENGQLWAFTQVDKWAGSFFSSLSNGSMYPMGGTPLAVYKSDIADRAQLFHLTADPFQSKFAAPDSVKLLDAEIVERDTFLDMVVLACFEPLVTDQINLALVENPGPMGGGYAEYILAEYQRRLDAYESIPQEERNASNRPTAVFNLVAIDAVAERLIDPPTPGSAQASGGAAGAGGRSGLAGRVEGAVTPDAPEGGEAAPETPADATPPSGAVGMLADPVAFFDRVIEKQVQPTLQALEGVMPSPEQNVVIIDSQWSQKPAGTYDSDGWLRVALPSIRLVTRTGEDTYVSHPPIAYSIEEDQNTGRRAFVDLVGRSYNSADAQINNVKLGWVFVLPQGHTPFRFEARQLGYALDNTSNGPFAGDPADYDDVVAMIGAVDVPIPTARPDGIEIGDTGAVVELSARLPRSISPNAATGIESNQDDEPWTAFRGTQNNILRGTSGGRRSQMREVFVAEGKDIARVIINADSNDKLLNEARQGSLDLLIRDSGGAEHSPIGFALMRTDDSMNLSLRDGDYSANDLPRVGTGETLYLYFEVRPGVNLTHFVLGQPDGQRIEFASPIEVE